MKIRIGDYCKQNYEGRKVNCLVTSVSDDFFNVRIISLGIDMESIPNSKFDKDTDKMFEEAVKPLIKYLSENHNPHTEVRVTSTCAELLEGQKTFKTDRYLID